VADVEPSVSEPSESSGANARSKRSWTVGAVALVLFLVVAALIALTIPRGGSTTQRSKFAVATSAKGGQKPAVELLLTVDSLAAAGGGIQTRLIAVPGEALPAQGATVFNSVGSIPTLVIRPKQIDQERTAFLAFQRGAVSDYPFDSYRVTVELVALAGTDTSLAEATKRTVLPIRIEGSSVAAGTIVTATSKREPNGSLTVNLNVSRSLVSRGWTLAMMAIYWALAILAACITFMVVRRRRPMETRLLAWLSAMVFALVALRTAAPGAPPVGTFLDYYAMFESVGIVAASLVVLMIYYLVHDPSND
jgi:cytochrome bd-type quinol oxidase subunit 1